MSASSRKSVNIKEPVLPYIVKVESIWKSKKSDELALKKKGLHVKVIELSADKQRMKGQYAENKVGWFPAKHVSFVREFDLGEHSFYRHSFSSPTWCIQCNEFIWGLRAQGFKCSVCRRPVHKRCLNRVPKDCLADKDDAEVIADNTKYDVHVKKQFSKLDRGKLPPMLAQKKKSKASISRTKLVPSHDNEENTKLQRVSELIQWLSQALDKRQYKQADQFKMVLEQKIKEEKQANDNDSYGCYEPLMDKIKALFQRFDKEASDFVVSGVDEEMKKKQREQMEMLSTDSSSGSYTSDDDYTSEDDDFGYNTFGAHSRGMMMMNDI